MRLDSEPFSYTVRKDGAVMVSHEGKPVVTLAGRAAAKLLTRLANATPAQMQMALAKATGNFRRGYERVASSHPRRDA